MIDYAGFAKAVRIKTLEMICAAKASHIGSCFSLVDLLAVLYLKILNIDPKTPLYPNRDRCLISKGHAAASVYATLALRGFFPLKALESFGKKESLLLGHVSHCVPGIEYSSGSLGLGLSVGCGMALGALRDHKTFKTYVIMSDGELNEGATWEAIFFAGHHQLESLTMIIDDNRQQALGECSAILDMSPLVDKLCACGWAVVTIDGHDYQAIDHACQQKWSRKPKAVIARTVKGKGISFMENSLLWHYKTPSNLEELLAHLV